MTLGVLRGRAQPSLSLRKSIGALYGENKVVEVQKMLDDLVGVDALARLLTEAVEKSQTKDGRVDMKDVAAFVLRKMKEDGT